MNGMIARDAGGLVLLALGLVGLGLGTAYAVGAGGWGIGALLVGGCVAILAGRALGRYDPELARLRREHRSVAPQGADPADRSP